MFGDAAKAIVTVPYVACVVIAGAAGAVLAWRGHSAWALLERVPARVFAVVVFAIVLASSAWAHERIHKGVPQVPDELGYLHTARTFAGGALVAESPPAPEFHYVSWGTHDDGAWYAVFPPGYPVLLAIGELVGAPWLVNPLLGAALALVLWALGKELFGRDGAAARVAPLLFAGSWFRLMNDGSFMAHPTAALAAGVAVLGVWRGLLRTDTEQRRVWAGVGGAALAYLGATRQLDAVIVAIALAPAVTYAIARQRRSAIVPLAIAAACALPIGGAYLAYNAALTGDPLLPPQQRYMQLKERNGDCFRLGFGPGVGECPLTQNTSFGKTGFQPRHAVANTRKRLDAWTRYSFGWAPLALLPVLGAALGSLRGGGRARRRALLAGVFVAAVLAYALFFYHGVAYGARFYYVAFPFVALLAAAFVDDVRAWLVARGRRGELAAGAVALALPALIVTGMHAQLPEIDATAGKRPHLQNGKIVDVIEAAPRDALVFVDSLVIPAAFNAHPNEVARNRPLVVKDLGDRANAGFARIYPDRVPYRLAGGRLVKLAYEPSAPMHHEGGALYPLERSRGGFGDRIASRGAGNLALSAGAALRFTVGRPGEPAGPASFAIPIWVLAADAGAMQLVVQLAHHAKGPRVDLAVDGAVIASGIATTAPAWSLVEHTAAVTLAAGRHLLEVRIPDARAGDVLVLDHVELRRRPSSAATSNASTSVPRPSSRPVVQQPAASSGGGGSSGSQASIGPGVGTVAAGASARTVPSYVATTRY